MEHPPLFSPDTGPEAGKGHPDDWEDPVTGLPGPAFWKRILAAEDARGRRYPQPATVVLAEIVGLDRLADLWGADMVGQALAAIAGVLSGGLRASDHLARLRASRFGLIMTETDEIATINFVDRVRELCARELHGAPDDVWVAFGWASPSGLGTLDAVAREAETRLRAEVANRPIQRFKRGRRG